MMGLNAQLIFDGVLDAVGPGSVDREFASESLIARCDFGAALRGLIRAGADPDVVRAGHPRAGEDDWELNNALLLAIRWGRWHALKREVSDGLS